MSKTMFATRLPDETIRQIKALAEGRHTSQTDAVIAAVDQAYRSWREQVAHQADIDRFIAEFRQQIDERAAEAQEERTP